MVKSFEHLVKKTATKKSKATAKKKTKELLDTFDKRIKTCSYIDSSELFKDCEEAWYLFVDFSKDCSWGDNDLSLIAASLIGDTLDNSDPSTKEEEKQIKIIFKRIDELGLDFFVNLEN